MAHRRMLAVLLVLLGFLNCAHRAFAAGGTCPSGANYLSPNDPAGVVSSGQVTLASFGVTSCYYISAAGSDSNTGTTEGTGSSGPWLHAPGMPNCTANCAAVTPAAGMGFIFRGGDTWHTGNSSPSSGVAVGGTWSWTWSGNSGAHIYIGVDPAWYSGSSWARPILNGDNPLNPNSGSGSGGAVSSCTYGGGGAGMVSIQPANYYHFDNFEMLGMCWGSGGGYFISHNGVNVTYTQGQPNPNPRWIENNYIHGWSHESWSVTNASVAAAFSGAGGYPVNGADYGVILQFNVVDGSDSDHFSLSWSGSTGDCYIVRYNVVRYNGADNSPLGGHWFHDNLFEWGYNADDGVSHTDWPMQIYGGEVNTSGFPGDGTPNLFYNNIVRHIPLSVSSVLWQFPPSGYVDYDFNNVFSDYEGSGNYNNFEQPSGGNMVVFNNTEEGQGAPNPGGCIYCNGEPGNVSQGLITSVNNHWIVSGTGTSAVFQGPSNVTETIALYQTISTANGQGYTVANNFAPTSSSDSTVTTAGTNETAGYCTAFTDPVAVASCTTGITSVSYNSTTHTVVYPAFTAVARPSSGAWNVGAYQYSSGGSVPSPPTGLSAVVQ